MATIAIVLSETTLKAAIAGIARTRRDAIIATGKGLPQFALQVRMAVVPDGDGYRPEQVQLDIVLDAAPDAAV